MMFQVDMRSLSEKQTHLVSDFLHESSNYLTVRDETTDFIKIELSDAQQFTVMLIHGTDIRKALTEILTSFCEGYSDVFPPNSHYAWWTRLLPDATSTIL